MIRVSRTDTTGGRAPGHHRPKECSDHVRSVSRWNVTFYDFRGNRDELTASMEGFVYRHAG